MIHAIEDYNRIQDPEGLIPEDEPVFLIRGQDIAAPVAIHAWANAAEALGASPEIVRLARRHATMIISYQKRTGEHKVPDLPEG